MNKYLRVAAGLGCLGVLILGVVALDPDGPLLSPFQGCAATRASLAEALELEEQLDQRIDAIHCRREAKRQVAEEVIARQCSLAEAIEAFRTLDRQWLPASAQQHALQTQKISEDEWHGWWVLSYVRQVLADRPDEAAAVAGRLAKELQELLADRAKRRAAPAERSR